MARRWKTGGIPLGFIVILRFRIDHRALEVRNLPDAIWLDHRKRKPLTWPQVTHGKWGSGEARKCIVATTIATVGALDRTVADSTLALVPADMPL